MWSLAHTSSTENCRRYCTPNCTGSMCLSESCTSSASWCTVAIHGQAPQYLVDLCLPVSDVASRQHLRSASRRLLVLPRHRLRTYGRRAFSVAGLELIAWQRDSSVSRDSFCKLLKLYLFTLYWNIERIRGSYSPRLHQKNTNVNFHVTYLS